jgi:hypothetical protein
MMLRGRTNPRWETDVKNNLLEIVFERAMPKKYSHPTVKRKIYLWFIMNNLILWKLALQDNSNFWRMALPPPPGFRVMCFAVHLCTGLLSVNEIFGRLVLNDSSLVHECSSSVSASYHIYFYTYKEIGPSKHIMPTVCVCIEFIVCSYDYQNRVFKYLLRWMSGWKELREKCNETESLSRFLARPPFLLNSKY